MKCMKCGGKYNVINSRYSENSNTTFRLRECSKCGNREKTYEIYINQENEQSIVSNDYKKSTKEKYNLLKEEYDNKIKNLENQLYKNKKEINMLIEKHKILKAKYIVNSTLQRDIQQIKQSRDGLKKTVSELNDELFVKQQSINVFKKESKILNNKYDNMRKELSIFKTKNHITFESNKSNKHKRRCSV